MAEDKPEMCNNKCKEIANKPKNYKGLPVGHGEKVYMERPQTTAMEKYFGRQNKRKNQKRDENTKKERIGPQIKLRKQNK